MPRRNELVYLETRILSTSTAINSDYALCCHPDYTVTFDSVENDGDG